MSTVSQRAVAFGLESHRSRLERFAELSAKVLRDFHAELPWVTERWGVDPTRVLERLGAEGLAGEGALDRSLLTAFGLFRDRHTQPSLDEHADVYRLPFALCAVEDRGEKRVVIDRVETGEVPAWMRPGAEITHWNGEPILEAAQRCGRHQRGRHAAAQEALGLSALTHRTTGSVPMPRAEWVTVSGQDKGAAGREQKFLWRSSGVALPPREAAFTRAEATRATTPPEDSSVRCFRQRVAGDTVGILRLRELTCDGVLPALEEMLATPLDALIVDLRGNAGGEVEAADRIVQRLAGGAPAPCLFQFRRSEAVRSMLERHSGWRAWSEPGCSRWLRPGSITPSAALEGCERFRGALIVLVDALTYSAAEILAGRLRERAGALLVGEHGATGGGLANAWGYSALESLHPSEQLKLAAAERRRDDEGAASREHRLRRWAQRLRYERSAGYSDSESGLWLLRKESGEEVAVEWRPECDEEHLACFDREAPLLPAMPPGFGLQFAIRRALVQGVTSATHGALIPDVLIQRRRLDVVRGDADFYRRCLRSARSQRVAAPRPPRPPSGDHSGETR